jgi:hypothetical protein
VVKLPGPAIKGKANGNTVAVIGAAFSASLYRVIPKIISKAIKNSIKAPATAKELTSIPISSNKLCPRKRKIIIMTPAINEAFSDCMCPNFFLRSIIIGMFPIISITANKIIKAVKTSFKLKLKSITFFFAKL